ncbi:oligosaccharide flippase family protein [Pseudooceanicola sp. LIPI14-2-Ac024]|uniref:oligosaccharide flippase family protein n=1 Tax=Pseudooceanicola sp. LIPI14-2-Ac024 TaxID=3344875 RepID=UPI0035D0D6CF
MTIQTDDPPAGARRSVLGDGAITVAERVVSQAAQFAVFIVAARVLGPAEFGIFALVSACAILLFRVAEFGWGPFIMAWSGDARVPQQVLSIAMICGAVFTVIGLLGSQGAAAFGIGAPTVRLMELFALWIMLATVSSAQKGIMIWQGRLKASALCEIAAELVGLAVSVAALLGGLGVLSLAFGRLAYQSVHLVLSFGATRLMPATGLRGPVLRDLWVFSSQIFVSRMFVYIRLYLATFIVGGFLGAAAVGYFRAADRLVNALSEIITVPAQLLAWKLMRATRDSGPEDARDARLAAELRRFLKVLVAIAAPVFLWLICMSDEVIHGLLSGEWQAAAPLVAILAVSRLFYLGGMVTEPVLSVGGHARVLPWFTGAIFAVSLALTLLAVQFGLYALAWAQVGIGIFVCAATFRMFRRYLGVTWRMVLRDLRGTLLPMALGTGTLLLLSHLTAGMAIPPLLAAIGFGLVALAVYALALSRCDRALWSGVVGTFRKGNAA